MNIQRIDILPSNLLSANNYSVSTSKPFRSDDTQLSEYKEILNFFAPEYKEANIDGYKIIAKDKNFNSWIAESEQGLVRIKLKRNSSNNVFKEKEQLNIIQRTQSSLNTLENNKTQMVKSIATTVKLRDSIINPDLFIPLKTNTPIDFCFSTEGGIMPATNYIIIGDPGIGKSSLTLEVAAQIQALYANKKVLFISAEMTETDMIPYTKRFPLWLDIDTIFVSDLEDGKYRESIENKLQEGYDLVVIDSLAELQDSLRSDNNEYYREKKSSSEMEKILIKTFVKHNKTNNDAGIPTAFLIIQQVTKGGNFVGTNALKHATTGMIEFRYTKSGARKIYISKNRRGFEYQNLEFRFSSEAEILSGKPSVNFNIDKIIRDKKVEQEIQKIQDENSELENKTENWLNSLMSENSKTEDFMDELMSEISERELQEA